MSCGAYWSIDGGSDREKKIKRNRENERERERDRKRKKERVTNLLRVMQGILEYRWRVG